MKILAQGQRIWVISCQKKQKVVKVSRLDHSCIILCENGA
uniref:Uncharacterized protein n=1 Tax=Rhizophora mucronata TaxID=61149 RepID=A0A2P2LLP4_RHIMU